MSQFFDRKRPAGRRASAMSGEGFLGVALLAFVPLATISACGVSEMSIEEAAVGDWDCTRDYNDPRYNGSSGTVSVNEDGTFSGDDFLIDDGGTWAISGGVVTIRTNSYIELGMDGLQIAPVPAAVTPGQSAALESQRNDDRPRDVEVSIDEDGVVTIVFAPPPAGTPQATTVCGRP